MRDENTTLTWTCNKCNVTFASARAREQHMQDSPAHQAVCQTCKTEGGSRVLTRHPLSMNRPTAVRAAVDPSGASRRSSNTNKTHRPMRLNMIVRAVPEASGVGKRSSSIYRPRLLTTHRLIALLVARSTDSSSPLSLSLTTHFCHRRARMRCCASIKSGTTITRKSMQRGKCTRKR